MQRMAEGVLRRLHNWGIAESELETLRKEGTARQLLTYRSPAAGVVLQKPSVQGMRFMPGETLYEIADLSVVWLVAEVFERDLGLVKLGQEAKLRILAYPEREFAGKVVFVSPTLEPDTRTARVRIELANPGRLLKPSMYGSLELFAGHPRGKVLAVRTVGGARQRQPPGGSRAAGRRAVRAAQREARDARRRLRGSARRRGRGRRGRGARQLPDRRGKQLEGGAGNLRRAWQARRRGEAGGIEAGAGAPRPRHGGSRWTRGRAASRSAMARSRA